VGGGVVLLNIAAYLDRSRIRVFCMSRSCQYFDTNSLYRPKIFAAPAGLSILGYFCVFGPFAHLRIPGFPIPVAIEFLK